jgi:arabinogalactan oligomer/maltooligosaccharide transport system permease protein
MVNVQKSAKIKRVVLDVLTYAFLIIICFIWVIPFVYLICSSLTSSPGLSYNFAPNFPYPQNEYWTFNWYIQLFTDTSKYSFGRWYLNTLFISLVTAFFQTIITLLVAYTFSRLRFKGRQALMKFMLIITMFPGFLSMICIYSILKTLGLAGNIDNPTANLCGLILVYVAGSATGYLISKGFFDTVSRSLDEAAMIDGASRHTIFWKIILPLSKPIIVYTILCSVTGPWGDYMFASYLVGQTDQKSYTVAVGLQQFLTTDNVGTYWSRFCAGGVFVSIPIVILFFFLQKYYVSGVTGGSVKG